MSFHREDAVWCCLPWHYSKCARKQPWWHNTHPHRSQFFHIFFHFCYLQTSWHVGIVHKSKALKSFGKVSRWQHYSGIFSWLRGSGGITTSIQNAFRYLFLASKHQLIILFSIKMAASNHRTYNTEGSLKTRKDVSGVPSPQLWNSELARYFGASPRNNLASSSREVMFNNWLWAWQDVETLPKMRQPTSTGRERRE